MIALYPQIQEQVVPQSATGIRTRRPLGTLTVQEVVAGTSPVCKQQQASTMFLEVRLLDKHGQCLKPGSCTSSYASIRRF